MIYHFKLNMKKKLLITFSGGRTSAFMARFIQLHDGYKDYEKLYIYANTGKEDENTLIFIDKCSKEWGIDVVWVEAEVIHEKGKGTKYKIVDFESASRKGQPFEQVIKKYGLPSKLYRHCTRELKEVPVHKYAKEILGKGYYTAMGIRADEKHRLSARKKYIYPLVEINIDEKFIRNWWDKQSFDLDLKDYQGNCDLCFLKSVRKKLTIIKEIPNKADWWDEMEDKYSEEKQPIMDVYRDLSIPKLIKIAQEPFKKSIDKQEQRRGQGTLFDIDMDIEFDCFCKSS